MVWVSANCSQMQAKEKADRAEYISANPASLVVVGLVALGHALRLSEQQYC